MKTCPSCERLKPLSEYARSRRRSGVQYECKECKRARDSEYYRSSPEKRAATKARNARSVDRNRRAVLAYLLVHACMDCGKPAQMREWVGDRKPWVAVGPGQLRCTDCSKPSAT